MGTVPRFSRGEEGNPMSWRGTISPHIRDIALARRAVADHMAAAGAGEEVELVTLLVSEVVSNAVLHGAEPRSIAVDVSEDTIHVEVSDGTPVDPVVRPVDTGRVSGNGMRIVEGLSTAWGVHHDPDGGKRVWFDVLRTSSPGSRFA